MRYFVEVLAILLAGGGVFLLGWRLVGRLLTPVGVKTPIFAVLPASGDGENLEFDVRGLLWMRGGGLARFTVVIADCGLSGAGRTAASLLAQREPNVVLCPAERVGEVVAGNGPG